MSNRDEPVRVRRRGGRARRRRTVGVVLAIVAILGVSIGAIVAIAYARATDAAAAPSPSVTAAATPTPTPTPLTPSEALLATTDDPAACAVSFFGDGIADAPMLQTQGTLYEGLPIPSRDGLVFAGWYPTPQDAASFSIPARLNGSDLVACTDREVALYGSWKTPDENAAEAADIPVLMYHQFTTKPEGESGWLRGNYAYVGDFDAHIAYIATNAFYLPTWDELSAFIDGRLFLPDHSVIVTDDDADQTWFDLGAPVVDKYKVLATSFMITAYRQDPPPNAYVLRRSHTHDMHRAGANGDGMLVNASADEIAADLETSASVLGVKEVVAYPFGHYNDTTKQGVAQAGFDLGRTIEWGYVKVGTDKLALPVIRINYGDDVDYLARQIGD